MNSKEDDVLVLFFNSSKHWHFEELKKESGLSRSRLVGWLKKFEKEGIIKRFKPKGKMPYYARVFDSKLFQYGKKIYALKQFTENGFLQHLAELPSAKVVIIFGSFSSYDWHTDSDIDIFIYGDDKGLKQSKYEGLLNREIQLHLANTKKDLKRMDKMLPYIIEGDFIKGSIQDLDIDIHAKA